MIIVSQSIPMPPLASLITPETRPNCVSSRMIAPIFSRGMNLSRYSLLTTGSTLASRKRLNPSTAACCSSVRNTYPTLRSLIFCDLLLGQDVDRHDGFLDAVETAAVFLD